MLIGGALVVGGALALANGLFLEPDYIVGHVDRIAAIPTHIVHGRFDQVCPLTQASRLAEAAPSGARA